MEIASIIEREKIKLSLTQCLIWLEIFELPITSMQVKSNIDLTELCTG
jgi:hypothetical protein